MTDTASIIDTLATTQCDIPGTEAVSTTTVVDTRFTPA